MTIHKKDQLKKLIEILTVVSILGGLGYGSAAWGWSKVCIPQVDEKVNMAIKEQEAIENQRFQKLLDISIENRDRLSRIEGKLETTHSTGEQKWH